MMFKYDVNFEMLATRHRGQMMDNLEDLQDLKPIWGKRLNVECWDKLSKALDDFDFILKSMKK